jgi:hypothetical protein
MFEAGVEHLFHAVHFSPERFFGGIDAMVGVCEALVDVLVHFDEAAINFGESLTVAPIQIGKAGVVD